MCRPKWRAIRPGGSWTSGPSVVHAPSTGQAMAGRVSGTPRSAVLVQCTAIQAATLTLDLKARVCIWDAERRPPIVRSWSCRLVSLPV